MVKNPLANAGNLGSDHWSGKLRSHKSCGAAKKKENSLSNSGLLVMVA